VPYVLGVAAFQLGYPVLLLVLPKVDDPPLNRHHAMRFRPVANGLTDGNFGTPRQARVVPVTASPIWDH
jgi:hypothetical protein